MAPSDSRSVNCYGQNSGAALELGSRNERNQLGPLRKSVASSWNCKIGFEIGSCKSRKLTWLVQKWLGSRYHSGRTRDWLKMKNSAAPTVKREAEKTGIRNAEGHGWADSVRSGWSGATLRRPGSVETVKPTFIGRLGQVGML